MVITSKSNQLIKDIIKLSSDRKFRKEAGLFVVEGIKPVNECLASDCKIEKIVCREDLADKFPQAVLVSESVFNAVSTEKTPQGVLALVHIPKMKPVEPKNSCLLLDRLQDPGNLGTIIRCANAAGYTELYLLNCTDAYSPKAVRASMSGIFFVKIYECTFSEAFGALANVPLICADMDGENIFAFNAPEKFCLCIGNEGGGISEEVMKKAQYKVKIPMRETCESLNAAVSAGIAMYQLKNSLLRG